MNLEELAAIAGDKSIPVPEDLRKDISVTLDTLEIVGNGTAVRKRRLLTACSIAASIALCAFAGMEMISQEPLPEDTFDDPYLAYAQIEKASALTSTKMPHVTGAHTEEHSQNNKETKAFDLISTKMQDVTGTTTADDSLTNN